MAAAVVAQGVRTACAWQAKRTMAAAQVRALSRFILVGLQPRRRMRRTGGGAGDRGCRGFEGMGGGAGGLGGRGGGGHRCRCFEGMRGGAGGGGGSNVRLRPRVGGEETVVAAAPMRWREGEMAAEIVGRGEERQRPL